MSSPPKSAKGWLAHYRELMGAWRRKNPQDGEDAMQDAVVGMLESGLSSIRDPRAYLSRSTANGLVDRHRRRGVLDVRPLDELDESDQPAVQDGQGALYAKQVLDALMAGLEELPPSCRKVYIQHRLEGWSHTEIAADMGISRSMVEKHMSRALLHLHDKLRSYTP
ncbi:sigma-70 family RNA polymerase sigma factor [Bordetella sp. N]|uniref:sigma-70 family RNA polymerase sigma factor n=1 Tax=Bordetella sp. N TaxID=1746199 RepID=UPI0009E6AAB2|nr:sigma-70 family RNA polymerase sigma factor [Bordetella sp. N]